MRNITIKVDETVVAWARVWAARHSTSVSRLLGDMLRERMEEEGGYEAAMKEWLAWRPIPMRRRDEFLPTREHVHER